MISSLRISLFFQNVFFSFFYLQNWKLYNFLSFSSLSLSSSSIIFVKQNSLTLQQLSAKICRFSFNKFFLPIKLLLFISKFLTKYFQLYDKLCLYLSITILKQGGFNLKYIILFSLRTAAPRLAKLIQLYNTYNLFKKRLVKLRILSYYKAILVPINEMLAEIYEKLSLFTLVFVTLYVFKIRLNLVWYKLEEKNEKNLYF